MHPYAKWDDLVELLKYVSEEGTQFYARAEQQQQLWCDPPPPVSTSLKQDRI